ncbi:MAG: cation transporter [Nanoarchaeota archaeon]|nr:cation transporter [Nanoarchaeota archaeon]
MRFKTKGMHCTSCEMLVKDALMDIDGVKKVKASFKDSIVDVDFDAAKVSAEKIAKTIEKEGYKVEKSR